jgi:hypothetical protein
VEWAAWTTKSSQLKVEKPNSTTQPGSQEPGCFVFSKHGKSLLPRDADLNSKTDF